MLRHQRMLKEKMENNLGGISEQASLHGSARCRSLRHLPKSSLPDSNPEPEQHLFQQPEESLEAGILVGTHPKNRVA